MMPPRARKIDQAIVGPRVSRAEAPPKFSSNHAGARHFFRGSTPGLNLRRIDKSCGPERHNVLLLELAERGAHDMVCSDGCSGRAAVGTTDTLPGCPSGADNLLDWDPTPMARSQELAHLW
jgi:hypothetical protein